MAAASVRPASKQEAMRRLRETFHGIKHGGRLIFDECSIHAIGNEGFDVSCTSYKGDPMYLKEFRLIWEGSYSMTVPFCDPTFRSVRQVPTMAHYFFVNGFVFSGDAARALKAYGLLSWLCTEDAETGTKR